MSFSTAEKISASEIPLRITSRRRWEPASGARETVSTPVSFRSAAISALNRSRRREPTATDPPASRIERHSGMRAGWSETAVPSRPIVFLFSSPRRKEGASAAALRKRAGRQTKPAAQKRQPRRQPRLTSVRNMPPNSVSAVVMTCSVAKVSRSAAHGRAIRRGKAGSRGSRAVMRPSSPVVTW